MVAVGYNFQPNNFIDPNKNTKMRGNDRAFVLEATDKTDTSMLDKRLLLGTNRIHAVRDEPSFNLWYFKYDTGNLPEELRGVKFTKFDVAKEYLEKYFNTRGIKIKEVID